MRHPSLLTSDQCLLVVIDLQSAFASHIPNWGGLVERSCLLIRVARQLGVPVLATEQYPKGLGQTVTPVLEALDEIKPLEKTAFSACADGSVREQLLKPQRKQVLLVGIETHVCVAQTAMDLLSAGLQPYLALDAVGSRRDSDRQVALERLRGKGVELTTAEAAIFEWLADSRHPQFREISKWVR